MQGGVLVLCGRRVLQEGGLQVRQDLLLVVPDLAQYGRGVRQVFEVRLIMVVEEKSIYVEHLLKAYKSRTCCLGYFFLRSTRFTYFNIYWYFYYFFNA